MLPVIILLSFCLISTSQSQQLFGCDFEESCEHFLFDSYWIVENVSSHADHTYGNLSGHYITYTNSSVLQPFITTLRTRDWINTSSNLTAWFSNWFYSGPGGVYYQLELAQGDDLQARIPVGTIGFNPDDPQWRCTSIEMPYVNRFVPFILFTNITSSLDLDDISVYLSYSSKPIPPIKTMFDCDFDKTFCPELVSLSNYSYSWSMVQAEQAQNYTIQAPDVDYSIGDKTGHYMWLNNSDSLQSGGAGYLSTRHFHFTMSDGIYCLSFQYYRFGVTFETSKLTVLALDEDNQKSVDQIWPIDPMNYIYINQRWSWAYAPLPIGNYSLLFRMDSEYQVNSSFAIDSISVSSCEYSQEYFSAISNIEFACDFDSSMYSTCGIQNDYTDLRPQSVLNFTIQSPNNINDRELGPRQTTGWSGEDFYYWSRSPHTSSILTSGQFKTPLIETNRDMCIRFAYFVNSTNVQSNENNTKIAVSVRGCEIENIWSIELDNSLGWQLVVKSFTPNACREAVYFRITQRRPTRIAVAFDDITIAQCGTLNVLTTIEPPITTPSSKTSPNSIDLIVLITSLLAALQYALSFI
ncbi:unnamed protein product [Rotaria magnacalcarata]|uniref:MAM domain-containing protein n=6 Tax=Rotaria magnacalcarata TaxID=392030 RepID=A0A816R2W5_9BILA|nr:unnamed protein product [Rotaria magnacalcarata]CAF1598834.1 unnamed protein product [Rotaria magnacalcarata]CAF2066124.1 unnamed protein product [Rotaria magnacalcarata]CAF3739606.1 unnamed protein product [Rotaria magnacalcarata]CAF4264457.1 unnamed protein product [Rotaria magnacalcarata]